MINAKMHTGCSCYHCRRGRNKMVCKTYHRKLRGKQKRQLKKLGDIKDVVISIGYTD